MPAEKLQRLDDDSCFGLPKVRGMPTPDAVSAVRAYLQSITVLKVRLRCMAKVYCNLMAFNVLHPWILYAIDGRLNYEAILFDVINNRQERHGREIGIATKMMTPVSYICFMTPDEVIQTYYRHSGFCILYPPSVHCSL
ncbi:hypothetical protein MTO96_015773 [Rhipicephalus appendiculatus]